MKVALCANLLGHKPRKTATTFGKCFPSAALPPLRATLPFQIVRILQTVGSFAHFLAIIMRCCLVPPRIRLSENFLYLIWPTVGACFTQLESHQRIQNTASKFQTPFTPCSCLSPCHPFICTVGHFSLCKPTLLIFSHSATKSNNNKLEKCTQDCCPTCLYPGKKLKKKRY